MRVMVIAPHPDDDLIGCGGSILKHLSQGDKVSIIYITNGDAENHDYKPEKFTQLRKEETRRAANVIGLSSIIFLEQPVWEIDPGQTRKELLKLIRSIKPDACYIPPSRDNHPDHRLVNRIALDALSASPSRWFKDYNAPPQDSWEVSTVLAYEVWSLFTDEEIDYVTDIQDFMEQKKIALYQHESQNTMERVLAIATLRLTTKGKGRYCEYFQVLKTNNPFKSPE